MDSVNVLSADLRGKVKKEVEFLPGAWVELYDDITVGAIQKAQEAGTDIENNLQLLADQISAWNFGDEQGNILPVSVDSLAKLPVKLLRFLSDQTASLLQSQNFEEKKSDSLKTS